MLAFSKVLHMGPLPGAGSYSKFTIWSLARLGSGMFVGVVIQERSRMDFQGECVSKSGRN